MRSVNEIKNGVDSVDSGFCNPRKIGDYNDARSDAIQELMDDHDYSRSEAERIVDGDD